MRCRDSESATMRELVKRGQIKFLRHAWHLTGDREAAWDLIQDSWVAIVKGIRALDDPTCFRAWAFRIVTNKCADRIRRLQTQRMRRDETAGDAERESVDPVSESIEEEEMTSLRQAIWRLPQEQRAVLALHDLEGIGTEELGMILEVPRGTIKSRLHHARQALKDSLERVQS